MRLHLIRHPRPQVTPGLCYGQTNLVVDALEILCTTSSLLPKLPKPAIVLCSPLQRCAGLADALVEAGGYPPAQRDANLMEMHFGAWEMQPWDAIDRCEIDAWANDLVHYRPGGGESVCNMANRVLNFCMWVQQIQHTDAIVVCHAGTIRLLHAWQHGITAERLAQEAASKPHTIGYGEINMVKISPKVCCEDDQRL